MQNISTPKVAAVLGAMLLTLVVLIVGYSNTPRIQQPVGAQDTLVFRNVHDLEHAGTFNYRWSTGTSVVALPQVGQSPTGLLQLHLWSPDNVPPSNITIADEQARITATVQGRRTIALFIPPAMLTDGDLHFNILSPTWSPPNNPRLIGVGIEGAAWQPLGWTFPPTRQLGLMPVLVLALALLLLRLGRSPMSAGISAASVGGLLALSAGLQPLYVAPYTHRLLLMVLLAHGALLLWTAFIRGPQPWWQLPHRVVPHALVLLLGIGYWMLLLYQRSLCFETVRGVCPRPGTQLIGGAALIVLLGLALVPWMQPATRWRFALAALAISGIAEASYAASFAFRRSGPDFFILWRAAYDFHLGRPLYKIDDVLTNHFGHVFKVPPFYGMLFLPFATADDNFILLLHRALNVVLYLLGGALITWLLRSKLSLWLALATVAVIFGLMQPPFDTIAYGQIDILLLLLLTLALLSLHSGRSWLVGLSIALGALFKLYPLLLVGFLVARREWKGVGWTAGWLALFNALAIGVMGWQNHVIYVTQVLPNIGGGTSWVENQTINGFLSRLLTGTMRTEPVTDPTINLLTYASFALIAGTSLLLALPTFDRHSSSFALQFSIFSVVMVLAVPAAWMHYATITILAFTMLVWYVADYSFSMWQAALLALAFSLIAYGNQWSFFTGDRHPGLPALALSYKFYGLVLLWGIMVQQLWQAIALRRQQQLPNSLPNTLTTSPS